MMFQNIGGVRLIHHKSKIFLKASKLVLGKKWKRAFLKLRFIVRKFTPKIQIIYRNLP